MRDQDKSVGRADNQLARACGLCLAAAIGAVGCGARSALPDLDAPPEQPAHTPDAGICTQPTPIELPESLSFHVRRPALTRLAHSTDVAVVYGLDAPGSNDLTAVPVGDVVFDPWGAWPPDLKGPFRISDSGGASFAVDVGDVHGFVLFGGFLESPNPCGMIMGYGEDLDPTAAGVVGWGSDGCPGDPQPALFMATNLHAYPGDLSAFLMGYDQVWGGTHHRLALSDKGAATAGEIPLCTKGPMVADGVPWEKGFLVAASGDMTAPDINFCDDSMESSPSILSLRLHTPAPPPVMEGASLSLGSVGDTLSRVRLAARGDGAWLFHQTRDTSGATSPIRAQRILVTGGSETGQIDVASSPLDLVPAGRSGFAAAPLGDGFALAWVEPGPAIGVAIFDDAGHGLGNTTVPAAPGATIEGPVTVLAAPDASALIVGWSETAPQQVARGKVVRFDCLGTKGL